MIETRKLIYLMVLAVGFGGPSVSFAGKCSGTNINNTISWEETEIANGSKLATWRGTSVIVSEDPRAPFHLASGECIGSFLINPDGKTRAAGNCARRDKDGDVLYEEWIMDATGNKGTFKNVGGTGKYVNAAGTAQYEQLPPLQGKMSAVHWIGNCQ